MYRTQAFKYKQTLQAMANEFLILSLHTFRLVVNDLPLFRALRQLLFEILHPLFQFRYLQIAAFRLISPEPRSDYLPTQDHWVLYHQPFAGGSIPAPSRV